MIVLAMVTVRSMDVAVVFMFAIRTMYMTGIVALWLTQVGVHGGIEMAAETIDPIAGLAAVRQVFVVITGAGAGSHVQFALVGTLVKNGGVIAAVKIGVCFYIKVLGKEPATITQSYGKEVG